MNNTIARIAAIARVEAGMLWRGRMLRVLLGSVAVLIVAQAAIGLEPFRRLSPQLADSGDLTALILFFTWVPFTVTLTVLLPFLVCDTIPKDPRLGVRELLESCPLSPGLYLLGKLFGVWFAVGISVSLLMVVIAVFWRVVVGPYDLLRYTELALIGVGSLALLNSGVGVLIPAGLSHVRSAAGALVTMLGLTVLLSAGNRALLDGVASLVRGPIINYYMRALDRELGRLTASQNSSLGVPIPSEDVFLTILIGVFQLILLFAAWRWWFRFRAAHR